MNLPKWMGKCPGCGEWNKMVEEVEVTGGNRRGAFAHSQGVERFFKTNTHHRN